MTPNPSKSPTPPVAPVLVWWVLWAAMTTGLVIQRQVLAPSLKPTTTDLGFIALGPFFIAIVLRVIVLPRFKTRAKAFPFFVVGLAMGEACALLGLFLGGPHSDTYVALGLATLLAYAPVFVRRYDRPAHASPFHSPL